MKLKMSENSLFAILLRSPWWISFGLVAAFALASRAFLPAPYVPYGVMGGFPFLIIGIMAARRQWKAPSRKQIAEVLSQAAAMSWRDFSREIEQGYTRHGHAVTRLNQPAADFRLIKDGRITLVSCKRWKAASQGMDALHALKAAKDAQGVDQITFISLAKLTDQASRFAQEQGIHIMTENELVRLLNSKIRH
jgi:restriction system protein